MNTTQPTSESWLDYWQSDVFWRESRIWEENAKLQAEKLPEILNLNSEDRVLSIGCGAGHLETHLAPLVHSILAIDLSDNFVEASKARTAHLPNVEVRKTRIEAIETSELFSLFLCISVVQYYEDLSDIEHLIQAAKERARPGARMLIADFPMKQSPVKFFADTAKSLVLAMKRNYVTPFLRTIVEMQQRGSHYKKCQSQNPELNFTLEDLNRIVRNTGSSAQILHTPLSCHAGRPSLLIHFE